MYVMKRYNEFNGKMEDVVLLEDAMKMADEVRQFVIDQMQEKIRKFMEEIEISEIVTEYAK